MTFDMVLDIVNIILMALMAVASVVTIVTSSVTYFRSGDSEAIRYLRFGIVGLAVSVLFLCVSLWIRKHFQEKKEGAEE